MIDKFMQIVKEYIDVNNIKVIYDIGAGSSEETVEFRNQFPNANIYAFECNPVCIANCAKNIINLDRIIFFPLCVNDYTGLTKFYPINQEKTITEHLDGNPRASSLYKANGTYPNETYVQDEITIPCMRIKDMMYMFGLPQPQILWIDLQGAELQALKGMPTLTGIEIIHTEVTNKEIYTGQSMYPEIRKHLEDNGFVCITDPAIAFPVDWTQGDMDFIRGDIYDSAK
jgi:FkbM family methyltransferase